MAKATVYLKTGRSFDILFAVSSNMELFTSNVGFNSFMLRDGGQLFVPGNTIDAIEVHP